MSTQENPLISEEEIRKKMNAPGIESATNSICFIFGAGASYGYSTAE